MEPEISPESASRSKDQETTPIDALAAKPLKKRLSFEERRAIREARLLESPENRRKRLAAEKERKRQHMIKVRQAIQIKMAQRRAAQAKVDAGMKITPEEQEALLWKQGKKPDPVRREKDLIAATAHLLLKPRNTNELRMLVEKVALEQSYNPMEELIKLTKPKKNEDGSVSYPVDADTRVQIHKALMPFLIPQLSAAKVQDSSEKETGIKVTVTSFVFPEDKEVGPIFKEAPKMVDVEGNERDIAAR